MDVNQEIVKEYFQRCKGYFVLEDVGFKRGSYPSDIDLLALDPKNADAPVLAVEVKWRGSAKIHEGEDKASSIHKIISQINDPYRVQRIREIIGQRNFENIFITSLHAFGEKDSTRKKHIEGFVNAGISVKFFEDIIDELVMEIGKSGKYTTAISQTIRMLKYYDHIKEKKKK